MARFKHSGHIDPSTGRNKRDKSTEREGRGGGVPRYNGKAVGRTGWRREQNVEKAQRAGWR